MLNKRIILIAAALTLLTSGPVFTGIKTDGQKTKIERKTLDKRALVLQAYLSKFNSPLTYQAQNFVDAADENNLDWKLVASIAGVESTFGKFIPGGYNAWGWGVYGTQAIYFDSWEDGINTVSEGLRKNYFNKGLTDPYSINRVYAASPSWGAKVTYFLADLERFQNQNMAETVNPAEELILKTAGSSAMPAPKSI